MLVANQMSFYVLLLFFIIVIFILFYFILFFMTNVRVYLLITSILMTTMPQSTENLSRQRHCWFTLVLLWKSWLTVFSGMNMKK